MDFRFNDSMVETIIWLKQELKQDTIPGTITICMQFMKAIIKAKHEGYEIILRKDGEEKNLTIT